MIQHFLLGVLTERPLYGYHIKKICDDHFALMKPLNYGSIYPNLKKLMDKGLVTRTVAHQDSRPNRKVYTLTQKGRREFQKWLHQPSERPPTFQDEFAMKFLFSNGMAHKEMLDLIDRQVKLVRCWKANQERKEKEAASDHAGSIYPRMLGELFREIHDTSLRWLAQCRQRIEAAYEDEHTIRLDESMKVAGDIEQTTQGRTQA